MKKLLMFLFAAFLMTGIAACNGEEEARTYAADGEYTAFLVHDHYGAPMITSVTVTVENDEITDYDIDALQSNGDTFAWNEQSKKELGYAYRMHGQRDLSEEDYITWLEDNDKLEWFEQAEIIEAEWLENGVDSLEPVSEEFESLAEVTISDGHYVELAKEAVENAENGVIYAYETSLSYGKPQVTWVEIQLDDNGDVEDITIDVLQSTITQTAGADTPDDDSDDEFEFAWNEDSKQELGYDYKMHYNAYAATDDSPTMAEYETWLTDNDKLEWFEQADLIADYVVENGLEDDFVVQDVDDLSAVSITTSAYESVLEKAFNKIG
jgi:hypothetical protein